MNRILTILLMAGMLCSCRPGRNDFSGYEFISPEGWAYGDTLEFMPELSDSVVSGMLTLSLRHTNDYLFSNIWLEVTTADSVGARTDTLNIILADEMGRWCGRGIGTDFQITDTIFPSVTVHRPVEIKVRHIMRLDILEDIEQVGVAFVEQI